jgi:hypothetical protein
MAGGVAGPKGKGSTVRYPIRSSCWTSPGSEGEGTPRPVSGTQGTRALATQYPGTAKDGGRSVSILRKTLSNRPTRATTGGAQRSVSDTGAPTRLAREVRARALDVRYPVRKAPARSQPSALGRLKMEAVRYPIRRGDGACADMDSEGGAREQARPENNIRLVNWKIAIAVIARASRPTKQRPRKPSSANSKPSSASRSKPSTYCLKLRESYLRHLSSW